MIVVRRLIDGQGYPEGVEIDIRGPRLQKALLELNKDVSGFGFSDDPPQVRNMVSLCFCLVVTDKAVQVDRKVLYFSLEGLERLLAEAEGCTPVDEEMIFELNAAIQFVKEDFAETFASLKTLLATNQITFEHLWTLYPPNTIVWCSDNLGNTQAYKVRTNRVEKDDRGVPGVVLEVEYIDSNGKDVGWRGGTLRIPWFHGVQHIWSLECHPLETGPDPELTRKRLIERGRLALTRHGQKLVEYKGSGLRKGERNWFKFNVRPKKRCLTVPLLD